MPKVSYIKGLDIFLNFWSVLRRWECQLRDGVRLPRGIRRCLLHQQAADTAPREEEKGGGAEEGGRDAHVRPPGAPLEERQPGLPLPLEVLQKQLVECAECECRPALIQYPRLVADASCSRTTGATVLFPAPLGR